MVTPDAPVSAVNNAHATNPTMASPAGIQPTSARVRAINRSDDLASAIR